MILINDTDRDENVPGYRLLSHEMGHALGIVGDYGNPSLNGWLMSQTGPGVHRELKAGELAEMINRRVYPTRQPCRLDGRPSE